MNDGVRRTFDLDCLYCQSTRSVSIYPEDIVGGVRAGCDSCGEPTPHICERIHKDEPTLLNCQDCGDWSGDSGEYCAVCRPVELSNRPDKKVVQRELDSLCRG